MTLLEENLFARTDILPSWFANAIQKFLSVGAFQFHVDRVDATHVQIPAGAGDQAAAVAIGGKWRWNEATVGPIAHPGGAAGVYPVFVTCKDNSIVSVPVTFTDATDRSFAVQIKAPGGTPTIVAGTVDFYRRVADLQWDGAAITGVTQVVPAVGAHAAAHKAGGSDPLLVPVVTALPGSPVDGQEIYYAADAANGVLWRLRYNAGSASAYKWEFLGGPPLSASITTSETAPVGAFGNMATVGPTVSVPAGIGGDYDVVVGCRMIAGGATGHMSYSIAGGTALDSTACTVAGPAGTMTVTTSKSTRNTGLAAVATSFVAKYRNSSGANPVNIENRFIEVRPVRVG